MDMGFSLFFAFSVLAIFGIVALIWHDTTKSAKPPKTPYDNIPEATVLDNNGHKLKYEPKEEQLLPSKTIRTIVKILFLIIGILLALLIVLAFSQQ